MNRKRVVILGATGSIGESALKVARDIPERIEIVGLAANSNAEKLAMAANQTRAQSVCLVDETKIDILRKALDYRPRIFSGEFGLREIACLSDADMVLFDPAYTSTIDEKRLHSRAGYDPFNGFTLRGVPVMTISRGEIIAHNGQVQSRPGRGQHLKRYR